MSPGSRLHSVSLKSLLILICNQSATALGATFNPELIETVGLKLLAGEAKLRGAVVVLAPTCNIQRVCSVHLMFSSFNLMILGSKSEPSWRKGEIM